MHGRVLVAVLLVANRQAVLAKQPRGQFWVACQANRFSQLTATEGQLLGNVPSPEGGLGDCVARCRGRVIPMRQGLGDAPGPAITVTPGPAIPLTPGLCPNILGSSAADHPEARRASFAHLGRGGLCGICCCHYHVDGAYRQYKKPTLHTS